MITYRSDTTGLGPDQYGVGRQAPDQGSARSNTRTRARGCRCWSVMACSAATWTASTAGGRPCGAGFRTIAPARFGYFDSTLPPGRHARRSGRRLRPAGPPSAWSAVAGFSAGSGSILEFGLATRTAPSR